MGNLSMSDAIKLAGNLSPVDRDRVLAQLHRTATVTDAPEPTTKMRGGRGVRREAGKMNRTEKRYAEHLEQRRHAGEVEWYAFEGVTLKLASDCRYTPDFVVMLTTGDIEAHEVKGFWRDDAKVKIRVAAAKFPFRFIAVKKTKTGWEIESF